MSTIASIQPLAKLGIPTTTVRDGQLLSDFAKTGQRLGIATLTPFALTDSPLDLAPSSGAYTSLVRPSPLGLGRLPQNDVVRKTM